MAPKRIRELDDGAANVVSTDSIPVDRTGLDEAEQVTLAQAVTASGVVASAISTHEGAADPHIGYLLETTAATTYQPIDADLTTIAAANNGATLAATTASFLTADETKLDGIEALADVTDAGNVAAAGAVMATAVPVTIGIAASDETTALTTGTGKATFRMPHAMTLTEVRASLTTASSSGLVTVDINEAGATILTTKLTLDQSERTSATAATAAVISDSVLADDAEITIDIDGAGTGATGLKVWLIGTRAV